jgi:tRNA pseudouridine38-40 synthase
MREAAAWLVGKHDFRSFSAALVDSVTVRTLRRLTIDQMGELLRLEFAADGFLHHMVRTIVGTLIEVGGGRLHAADLAGIREARDRSAAGFTAPAQGLYLAGVRYAGYDSFSEPPLLRGAAAGALDAERAFP